MDQTHLERSIWIAASRDRVWQALTDPTHVAQWLLPPALGAQLTRSEDGLLTVCMGPMQIPIAIMDVVEPLHQLTSRGFPDQVITITYTLTDERSGTQVTVRLSGFEALPSDARHERLAPSGAAWEKALANVKAYVDGTDLPFPGGQVTALFGYRRVTKQTFAVERSIWIAAPRERVWQAITDPAQIEAWYSPGTAWRLTALKVGGRLFVRDSETGGELYTQVIEVVDPPQRLVLRSEPDASGSAEGTIYALHAEQTGTRLTITHTGYERLPEDERWNAMEQNGSGFGMVLENVQAFIDGRQLPYPGGF